MDDAALGSKSAAFQFTSLLRVLHDARGRTYEVRGCCFCLSEFSFKGGTTSAALRHLKRSHPEKLGSPAPLRPIAPKPKPLLVAAQIPKVPSRPLILATQPAKAVAARKLLPKGAAPSPAVGGQGQAVVALPPPPPQAPARSSSAAAPLAAGSTEGSNATQPNTAAAVVRTEQRLEPAQIVRRPSSGNSDADALRGISSHATDVVAAQRAPVRRAEETAPESPSMRNERKRPRGDNGAAAGDSFDEDAGDSSDYMAPQSPSRASFLAASSVDTPVRARQSVVLTASQSAITHFLQHYKALLSVRNRLRFVKHLTHHPREAEMYNVLDAATQIEFVKEFADDDTRGPSVGMN